MSWLGSISITAESGDDGVGRRKRSRDKSQFAETLARVEAGDTKALPELRRHFDENPLLQRSLGDVRHEAERTWIELSTRGDRALQEASRSGTKLHRVRLPGLSGSAPGH